MSQAPGQGFCSFAHLVTSISTIFSGPLHQCFLPSIGSSLAHSSSAKIRCHNTNKIWSVQLINDMAADCLSFYHFIKTKVASAYTVGDNVCFCCNPKKIKLIRPTGPQVEIYYKIKELFSFIHSFILIINK